MTTAHRDGPMHTIFFVSCSTGITAETLGHSLMTQFEEIPYQQVTLPFVDTLDKVGTVIDQINQAAANDGRRPVVFCTLANPAIRRRIEQADCEVFDFFDAFIEPLEQEFAIESTHSVGRSHGMADYEHYMGRIDAINFALANDDLVRANHCDRADIVLVGLSRTGKTPLCLYLALQHRVRAANLTLTDGTLDSGRLPATLLAHRAKLQGVTIDPQRLHQLRTARRPNTDYASLAYCVEETRRAEAMFEAEAIPYIDTTHMSIEELASFLFHSTGMLHARYLGRHHAP